MNNTDTRLSEIEIYALLEEIKDPEIPVISVVEMGIIRGIILAGDKLTVRMTPTYTGCPALDYMRAEIFALLRSRSGFSEVEVVVDFNDAWSSNLISESGLRKLTEFGLAPPGRIQNELQIEWLEKIHCPQCGSVHTSLQTMFGPTLCRSIHICHHCGESFEAFKPI